MQLLQDQTTAFRSHLESLGRDRLLELITLQDPKLAEGVERCEWVFENKLSHLNWTDGTPILERKFTNAELALLIDEPFEPSEQLTDYGLSIAQQRQLHVAKDPVVWARDMMGFKSRVYQTLILRHPSLRKVLRAGRRLGKALALDTPIPTEFGFKPMKDISVGDRVFDETGKLCNVTFISDIQSNRKCYNVKFSDGSVIKADAEHLWTVQTKRSRKARQRATNPVALEETLTTEELKQNLYVWCGDKYEVNYSIDVVSSPLEYPEKDLVIDPYVLGYWLGDGSSADGRIHTGDEDIILEFKKVGYEVRQSSAYEYTYQVHGLNTQLRSLNLIKNKHIPDDYMYAAPDQRLALLQGLMDADGHCTPRGTCEISQKNQGLASDIKKLVESLGIRASMRDDPAKLYGKDCGRRYRVGFTPWQEVFRLERKLANVRLQEHPSPRQISRYIVAIEETGSVDVKCIQVDSPKSLYLAGYECIPTHNTTSMAIMLLHYSWTTTNGKCIVVTPMKAQGGLIYEEILKWANKSPDVQEAIVRKVTSPQYEINFKNGSTIRFFSSGTKSGGKCLTPDHDVLTEDGWKPIADVVENERVASWDDGTLVWKDVNHVWEYDYDDDLVTHTNKQLSFAVTPNHKVLTKTNPDTKYLFREASDLKGMHYFPASGSAFGRSGTWFSGDELELWGWWLAEGSGFIGKMARISQAKPEGRKRIIELAQKLGLHYTTPQKEIRVEWRPPVDSGTNAYNKFIPRLLFDEIELPRLLEGLLGGDGYIRRKGWEYSSSSHTLANDVQELAFRLGLRSSIREKKLNYKPVGGGEPNPHWVVSAYPREYSIMTPSHLKREKYSGKVHCLTVEDTGTFFVRREGKIHLTGNSDVTRGQEAHMIVLDEMDYMHPDDLVALYAMLQATDDNQPDKVLVGASTPTGRQEIFFDWCTDPSEGFREFYFPSYCFIPGQLVGMADGSYKQIEDIIEGDLVKTENGPQRVVRTFERDYDGDIVGITTYGHSDPVYSTPEHPFMAAQRNFKQNPSYRGKRVEANWDWVDAGDLSSVLRRNQNSGHFLRYILDKTVEQNDFIDMTQFALHQCMDRVMITPRSKNSLPTKVYLDESLATLAGWYLAEGSVDNNSIEWTLSKAEFHVAEEIQNALHKLSAGEARISTEERYNTLRVRITNGALVVLLSHLCGVGSKEKQMSREIMYADFGFQRDLLKHYARGDGWEFSPGDFDIRTTSKVLAMQLRDICSRLGQIPSISTSAPSSRDFGNGYGVYQTAKSYCINYRTNTTNMLGKRYDSEHAALLIKDIQRHKYTGKVYNFEVENTNTYTVNGLLVHNCNPKFTKEIEDELRKRYGEMGFRHEIEADWGEPSDGVYPRRFIDRAFSHKNWKYKPEAKTEPGTYHVIGVDWDKYKATPNIVILKVYTHKCEVEYLRGKIKLVHREVIDKDQFALTNATDRIIQLNDIFNPEHIYVDRGLGETQVELLKKHGIKYRYTGLADKVRGVAFQENVEIFDPATKLKVKKPVKAFMVENLRTFLEQEKIWFPDTDVALFKQLISYIVTISPSGNHKFEAGGTAEDHIHDALALACLAITENYGEFADVEVGTKARVVSLDPFLALANLSTNPDVYEDQIARAEEVYGSVSASPIQTRRKMTYTKRTGSRPIKRKMF